MLNIQRFFFVLFYLQKGFQYCLKQFLLRLSQPYFIRGYHSGQQGIHPLLDLSTHPGVTFCRFLQFFVLRCKIEV